MKVTENLADSRYAWAAQSLRELLPTAPSQIVSDVGAGSGEMRRFVEQAGGQWQGFDLSPQLPEIVAWNLDDPAPPQAQAAGIVLLLDVLEHLNNPWLAVKNLTNLLLPGGVLILSVPNPGWSRSRFNALLGGKPACFTQADLELNHHVFTPWSHIVERLLNDAGLQVEKYVTLDGPTKLPGAPYNFRYPLRFMFALLNQAIEWHDPAACGMSYGIVARKGTP